MSALTSRFVSSANIRHVYSRTRDSWQKAHGRPRSSRKRPSESYHGDCERR